MKDQFIESNDGSMKRISVIFYVSYLLSYFFSQNLPVEHIYSRELINWIFSIINPIQSLGNYIHIYITITKLIIKINNILESKITPYDKIIGIYGLIDLCKTRSPIMDHVKKALTEIVQTYGVDIIPIDLLEKMIKLKIYNN